MAKMSYERWKTWGNVFDQFTIRNLFKLSSQGHFIGLDSPVSIGKEANIFTAIREDGSKVIVKIYRLETANFNKMFSYLKTDPRYYNIRRQKRQVIFTWAQREYRNLMKARLAHVTVPTPIANKDNILVLEHIGKDKPAPQLKDLPPKNNKKFIKEVLENVKKLYQAGLIHADLSEFNILNDNDTPVLIDFSQCTSTDDPHAEEYLKRDTKNIVRFSSKQGVNLTEEEILETLKKS